MADHKRNVEFWRELDQKKEKRKKKKKKTKLSQQKRKEKLKHSIHKNRNSVRLGFFFFFFLSTSNLGRWNNGGGAMEEEIDRERNVGLECRERDK